MSTRGQKNVGVVGDRNGIPIYEKNPSIPLKGGISTKTRKRQFGHETKGLVIDDGTGAIIGRGTAIAYELEEVDDERFVKLFLDGLRQATGMTKAGLSVFEVVYFQIQEHPNVDEVKLNHYVVRKHKPSMIQRTYNRGLRELLDRQFLYLTPVENVFFVNIRYMFNGDRLAFVQAYHRKGAKRRSEQGQFPFVEEESDDA